MHTELVTFSATQPNTGAAAAAVTGDSLTVKKYRGPARIVSWWAMQQVDGWQQLITPTQHDTTRGVRLNVDSADIVPLFPLGLDIDVQPQEVMSIQIAGSNTAGDVELGHMLIHYPDLPGVTQRSLTWSTAKARIEKLTTLSVTLTGAAAGYTGSELITAETDLLQANRDYAVLGYLTTVACGAIGLVGPDTGYARVAGPGSLDPNVTRDWFCQMSRALDKPMIPIINSGNKANTNVFFAQNENNVSPTVSFILGLLKK